MQNLAYLMVKISQNEFSKTLAIACGGVVGEKATITQMREISRLLLCLDNKCYHCQCHHHRFLKIGLWGLLTAAVWTCLFEGKSFSRGQLLFVSASASEDLKQH